MAYRLDGAAIRQAVVRDIGSTGAYLVTDERLPAGTLLSLTVLLEGPLDVNSPRRLTSLARVAHLSEDGIDIEFIAPASQDEQRWASLIERLVKQIQPSEMLPFLTLVEAMRFLCRICPQAAEDFAQLFCDRLGSHKVANAVDIIGKARNMLGSQTDGGELRVDTAPVLRILEVGSGSDEGWVRDNWAGLLSTCCRMEGDKDADLSFVNLFGQLTQTQIRIINTICDKFREIRSQNGLPQQNLSAFKTEELASSMGLRGAQTERDIQVLCHVGLLKKGADHSLILLPSDTIDVAPTERALELYYRCQGRRGAPEEPATPATPDTEEPQKRMRRRIRRPNRTPRVDNDEAALVANCVSNGENRDVPI